MSSLANIYGQIGAAKAFSSSVSRALDDDSDEREIKELEEQLANTEDEDEQKRLKKKIKRQKRKNKRKDKLENASRSVTDFLANIASFLDIGIRELIKWIANIIVSVLPALEVSIKMLLLTNIKKLVSCSIDPRIPDEFRTNGIYLNEAIIDPRRVLMASPFSKWGRYMYFGCFNDKEYMEPKSPYSLSRADDMNAFLWFSKNCAHFVTSTVIAPSEMNNYFDDVPNGANFNNTHEFKGLDDHRYIEGCTFKHPDSETIYLCTKKENRRGNDGLETWYIIVPVTNSWVGDGSTTSVWYKDRTTLTGLERKINYDKSKPLFHLEYVGEYIDSPYYLDGNFKLKILPKPFGVGTGFGVGLSNYADKMVDYVDTDQIQEYIGAQLQDNNLPNFKFNDIQNIKQVYARFNSEGEYDRNGRFSINLRDYWVGSNADLPNIFYIYQKGANHNYVATMELNPATKEFTIEPENGVSKQSLITECYFGKTIFEFNYDYVVSMKLFDEKAIASSIINTLMNIDIPNPLKSLKDLFKRDRSNDNNAENSSDQVRIDAYVDKLVEKMIETETGEYTDCFYTFSNEDYEAMEQNVVNKIANNTLIPNDGNDSQIQEIYNILDAYDADATLHERTETITNALMKTANSCGFYDDINDTDVNGQIMQMANTSGRNSGGSILDFIKEAVKVLTSAVVNALLSPKVLMLIQVNRILMGMNAIPEGLDKDIKNIKNIKDNYELDVIQTLDGLSSILKDVIREIIDTILKEFLRMILERLKIMMYDYIRKLGLEIAMKWVNILRMLISCFKFNRNKMNSNDNNSRMSDDISSIINQVDYADIDTLIDEIIPNTNPC